MAVSYTRRALLDRKHPHRDQVVFGRRQPRDRVNPKRSHLVLGFLGLGLVIGVAALGVISARSVVERRQQIGVLRAIGFQARMVQMTFLIEPLFITMIGVVIGTVLGLIVAANVITDAAGQPGMENLQLKPPWTAIAVILVMVVLSTIVTTWLPSLKASRTYPAAALRYE